MRNEWDLFPLRTIHRLNSFHHRRSIGCCIRRHIGGEDEPVLTSSKNLFHPKKEKTAMAAAIITPKISGVACILLTTQPRSAMLNDEMPFHLLLDEIRDADRPGSLFLTLFERVGKFYFEGALS